MKVTGSLITGGSVSLSTEPISLADVLVHTRLDSTSLANNIETHQSIFPGDHVVAASYSLVGTGVNVAGYLTIVNLSSGTCGSGGTVDVKIQESDTTATTNYTDWSGGAFTQVGVANDNAVQEKEYTGSKPYVRTVATVAGATCDFSVDVILSKYTPSDAAYISNLITVVRQHVENEIMGGVATVNRTNVEYLYEFPSANYIELPYPPRSSITSITYTAAGDTTAYQNTFSSTSYNATTGVWPGRITLRYGESWPTETLETNIPIKLTYVAGFGATASNVPPPIRQCMLMYVDDLYEHRGVHEMLDQGKVNHYPIADMLVNEYRNFHF